MSSQDTSQDSQLSTQSSPSTSTSTSPLRRTMSVTQTYYLAHTARGKLSTEASRPDHNLRLLVGHANLLDSLMLDLAEAEQEQEIWFNQSVKKATRTEEPRHIQWADSVVEDPADDWQAEDADSSDSDSDYDSDEDVEMEADMVPLQRVPSASIITSYTEVEEVYDEDEEEDLEGLALHLTQSHSTSSPPPELDHDSDESSEDESMPPSPSADPLPSFSEKQRQQIATTGYYSNPQPSSSIPPSEKQAFFAEGLYLPPRTGPGLISTISVF